MSYAVRREPEHLVVSFSAVPTREEARKLLGEMLLASGPGVKGALLEAPADVGFNARSNALLVRALAAMGFAKGYRVAFLLSGDKAFDSAEVSGIGVRAFSERDAALAWLRG
jgi:hypothetical protein